MPDGCTVNCEYAVTWKNANQAVGFEMSALVSSNNYWVAFGLSLDQEMVEQPDNLIVAVEAAAAAVLIAVLLCIQCINQSMPYIKISSCLFSTEAQTRYQ